MVIKLIQLRELRKSKGISQQLLANTIGVSRSTVAMWETDGSQPDNETLAKLADYFGVSVDFLLGRNRPKKPYRRIPVLGRVPAGIPIEAVEDEVDWEDIGEEFLRTGHEYIGLLVKGDSMLPNYQDSDVLIVRLQPTAETGDDAVVFVNGDDATFKRISRAPNGIHLRPLNPEYDPLFFTNEEIEELPIRVLGVAVEVRRKLRK